MKCIEKMEQV